MCVCAFVWVVRGCGVQKSCVHELVNVYVVCVCVCVCVRACVFVCCMHVGIFVCPGPGLLRCHVVYRSDDANASVSSEFGFWQNANALL